ncbi:MAG: DUF2461 domain-containing protein [Bythopirellula sp.]|nr:DUF2461 domain-containing protein [Bythopirellula sp.]
MPKQSFPGFPEGLVPFFRELAKHNNRSWFEANRARYEADVREPALAFITAMAGPLSKISPNFVAIPKKVGGSLMRIHRDVRFSKDKKPYKTNLGIHFRHAAGKDVHAPGFYFHVDPQDMFLGAGIWHPDSEALSRIREAIDDDPSAWKKAKANKPFVAKFELTGDTLRRPPQGYAADNAQIVDLKRKDFIGICRLDHEELLEPAILEQTVEAFRTAKPLVGFLCRAVGVKF